MAVPVVCPNADHGDPRRHCGDEARQRVARTVVRDLEHVGPQVLPRPEQIGLSGEFDVAGEQDSAGRRAGHDHQRAVVDLGAVLLACLPRYIARPDDVQTEPRPAQPLPGSHFDDPDVVVAGDLDDLGPRPMRRPARPDRDAADRAAVEHGGQPADVIRVQVAQHQQRHAFDVEPIQAPVDLAQLGAGVDHHRTARLAGGHGHSVALADVTRDHGPPGRRPPRAQHRRRDQDDPSSEHRDRHGHTTARVPEQQHEADAGDGGEHPAPPARRPGDHRARNRRCLARNEHQPADFRPGELHQHLGQPWQKRRTHRRQEAEDGGRRDHGRCEHVGGHRRQPDLAGHASDNRNGDNERRERHGECLCDAPGHTATTHRLHPCRREQHQRAGRDD